MRSKYILALTAAVVLACSKGGSDIEDKKAELQELKAEQSATAAKIKQLESELGAGASAQNNTRAKTVKVTTVAPAVFKHFIEVQGTIDSDNNILVSPKTGGVITRVLVNEGDQVSKGKVLAEIDNAVMRESIEEVKTGLSLANTVYEKQKNLWDQKIGSEIQFLQAKNSKESLERKLQTLRSQLAQSQITSPISGVVDEVRIKPGEAAAPGMGVIRVVNLSGIKVMANLSDTYISAVSKGETVEVKVPDINKEYKGKISFVGQVVNPTSRTFPIEAVITNKDNSLKPNMLAVINVNDQTKQKAIVITQNNIQKTELGDIVYVAVDEGGKKIAKARKIKTGLSYNGQVEILEGLAAGDLLITDGYQELVDGQAIQF